MNTSMPRSAPAAPPPEPKWSWKVWWIWCAALTILGGVAIFSDPHIKREGIIGVIFIGPFGATFYYGCYFLVRRFLYRIVHRQVQTLNLTERAEALQEELEKDFFTNLVRINFKYLDKYYLQTQEQGDKSFLLSGAAAVVGLLIIIAGITLMFFDKTDPAYLTTAAGVLSEFIAAVFFYLYNRTVMSMSQYHQKLVITQNIALALKITNDLPQEERVRSQLVLVEALTKDVNHLLSSQAPPISDKP